MKMYTRRWCGYCTAAERLLDDKGVPFENIDVTGDHEKRKWLVEITGGYRTVPVIYIGEKFIGGYDELRALERHGELDALLAAARPSP